MILTGNHIRTEVLEKRIVIEPFVDERLTTNSYDLTLGDSLVAYEDEVLNPKTKPRTREIVIPDDGYVMQRGGFSSRLQQ